MNPFIYLCIYTIVFITTSILTHLSPLISAQQPYLSNICPPPSKQTTSVYGYSCNGLNTTCQTYLIYRTTQPPYNNLTTISSLFSVNVSHLSSINNHLSIDSEFPTNTEIIVPVTCSCSGKFYQANTTYSVVKGDNYYAIANNTFEGLTTCKAIRVQKKSPNVVNIYPNEKLTIPIRCACPTKGQVGKGVKYLMSFVVQNGNSFSDIATKFGADIGQTLDANQKSEQDSVIYPFTTILVPLEYPPNGSLLEYPSPISPSPSLQPFPTPSVPSTSHSSSSSSTKWVFFGVGMVVGAAFVLVIGVFVILVLVRMFRKKNDQILSSEGFESQEKEVTKELDTEPLECLKNISGIASLKVYTFMDLQGATEDFSSRNWIKGSVYKGVLDGDEVAIKKMNGDVSKEISVLNKINHFNLIRLLGVCFSDGVWYLVYEYACNGPLSEWIYQNNLDQKPLSWANRMQVAFDVATGVNYLHRYTTPPYVHKDIKSSNILIDSNFRAKIAKFGLSRSVRGNIDSQFTLTKHIVGTKGYLAPEYVENGLVSPMLDVYSFGVLLLEILTGKDVLGLYEGVKVHLSEVLTPMFNEGGGKLNLLAFMDPSLGENYPEEMAMSLILLVDRCLKKDPGIRPSMDEIVQILSKVLTDSLIWNSSSTSTSL